MPNIFSNLNPYNKYSDGSENISLNPGYISQLQSSEEKIPVKVGAHVALQANELKVINHPQSIAQAIELLKFLQRLMIEAHSGTALTALNASYRIIKKLRNIASDNPAIKYDLHELITSTMYAAEANPANNLTVNEGYMNLNLLRQTI